MLLYQVLHAVDRSYALTVFWLFVGAFVLTFGLIFIFPPGAIVMVFLGLLALGLAVLAGKMLGLSVRAVARSVLVRGRCPRCDEPIEHDPADETAWRCPACRAHFLASGAEPEVSPLDRDHP